MAAAQNSRYTKNDRLLLPLRVVNEYKEKERMNSLDQAAPSHQMYEDESCTPFWRRCSSSSHLSQVANLKKHDTLPSWGNPQDGSYVVPFAQPKSRITFTTSRKKADAWSFLTFCLVLIGGMTYWHLQSSLNLIIRDTESAMAARTQINFKLRSAEKDLRGLSREIAATTNMLETQRERQEKQLGESIIEAQSSLEKMEGQYEDERTTLSVLKDAVQDQSRRNVEYAKKNTIRLGSWYRAFFWAHPAKVEDDWESGEEPLKSVHVTRNPMSSTSTHTCRNVYP